MNLTRALRNTGISPRVGASSLRGVSPYLTDRRTFLRQAAQSGGEFRLARFEPHLGDRGESGGVAAGQYFHQDLFVAQEIFSARPMRHVDVGSRVDGFVAHVASFRPIEVHDIRPLVTSASNIEFIQRNITSVDQTYDDYTDSLSCLHTLEHFGLGRYGDPVDYYGYKAGLTSMARMLKIGGTFYLSVPASEDQRIEFNAHRIFSLPYLIDLTHHAGLELRSLSYVDDAGDIWKDMHHDTTGVAKTFGLHHGCVMLKLLKTDQ